MALGGLSIRFARADALSPDLVEDLEALGDAAGQALHRAQLDAAERASRNRLEALQHLTGALSRAPDRPAVAAAAARHALDPLRADAATLVAPEGSSAGTCSRHSPTRWPGAGCHPPACGWGRASSWLSSRRCSPTS